MSQEHKSLETYTVTEHETNTDKNNAIDRFTYTCYILGLAEEQDVNENFLILRKWVDATEKYKF